MNFDRTVQILSGFILAVAWLTILRLAMLALGLSGCETYPEPEPDATPPDGCADRLECSAWGLCAGAPPDCVATAEGCAASDTCRIEGRCAYRGGQCSVSVAGCRESEGCARSGYCHAWFPRDSIAGLCVEN